MKPREKSEWVEERIGDVADLFGGSTPSSADPVLWNGNIRWLVPSDITTLQECTVTIADTPTKITLRGYESCATKMLPAGTVCVTSRATVGDCIILEKDACTNQGFVNVVCGQQLDPLFFLYWVRQHKNVLLRLAAGTTFDEIGRRSFRNIAFSRPKDVQEQQAIGAGLQLVDNNIAAARAAIAAAQRVRKRLTEELLAGRVRADGTARAPSNFCVHARLGNIPQGWRDARLRDMFRLKNGKSNVTANLRPAREGAFRHPVYGGNGMTGWSDRFFVSAPTVVIGRVGEYCGATHATPADSWVTDNALYVEERLVPLHVRFLFHLLTSLRLNRWKATTGQPKITQSEILNIRVAFPEEVEEQHEIATALDAFHDLVEVKEAKITALQRVKKSLMQNLLTGRMRLSPEAIAALTKTPETERAAVRHRTTAP